MVSKFSRKICSYVTNYKSFASGPVASGPFSYDFSKCWGSKRSIGNFATDRKNEDIILMGDVREKIAQIMGVERGYHPLLKNRSHLLHLLPLSQDELPVRSMKDSFDNALIPLSSNIALQERYTSLLGYVRLGRLMEDMDIFAVWLVLKHISNPKQKPGEPVPYVIVTVLVDQIAFTDFAPKVTEDIRISGHVSWVGKSSIETTVWLEQFAHGSWHGMTKAVFLMAARDADNMGSAVVNRLEPATDEERKIHLEAEGRKKRRLSGVKYSLLKYAPTTEEQRIIHNLFTSSIDLQDSTLNHRTLPSGAVWMDDTKINNVIFSHPENRNLHNKVFGGYLMRSAAELAFLVGYLHCKNRPRLIHISDISFKHPVEVGSLLRMNGLVVYTEHRYMQILLQAEVHETQTNKLTTTNMFHYTYETPMSVTKVFPNTYQEAMMYIDGRRHFQSVMGLTPEVQHNL